MLLACPSCSSAFRLPATAIAADGRAVRCSNCQHVWTAVPADLIPEPQLEEALVGAEPAMVDAAEGRMAEAVSLTGDSQLDAEIEAAFADADRSYDAFDTEVDDIVAIDRPLEAGDDDRGGRRAAAGAERGAVRRGAARRALPRPRQRKGPRRGAREARGRRGVRGEPPPVEATATAPP